MTVLLNKIACFAVFVLHCILALITSHLTGEVWKISPCICNFKSELDMSYIYMNARKFDAFFVYLNKTKYFHFFHEVHLNFTVCLRGQGVRQTYMSIVNSSLSCIPQKKSTNVKNKNWHLKVAKSHKKKNLSVKWANSVTSIVIQKLLAIFKKPLFKTHHVIFELKYMRKCICPMQEWCLLMLLSPAMPVEDPRAWWLARTAHKQRFECRLVGDSVNSERCY